MARQYTRQMICDTFIKMLNERPLKEITVKDIVTACEINRNTFYYYFTDIYEIIREIFDLELQKVIDEYNNTLSWEECFLKATSYALENKKAVYHIYYSVQREVLEKYLFDVAGNVMGRYVERMKEGIKASRTDMALITLMYQGALTQIVIYWISNGMKEDPEKMILRIGKLFDGNITLSLKRSEQLDGTWI